MSESWETLADAAEDLPNGLEKVALLEQAVRVADQTATEFEQFDCRLELLDAANYAGCPEKVLVAFSWLLGKYDQSPEEYSSYDLMWRYKWVSAKLCHFPQITQSKIASMHDDMEKRFRELCYSVRPVHGGRFINALRMGDFESAKEHHELYSATPRDWMSDCAACECDTDVDWLIHQGKYAGSIEKADPILLGKLSCGEVPESTYALVLRPLALENRLDEAEKYHSLGYRRVAKDREYLTEIAFHLQYLSRIEKDAKAIRLVEQHLPIALNANDPLDQFQFFAALYGFFAALAARRPRAKKMMLPTELPLFNDEHKYAPAALAEHFETEAKRLADRFNVRNENTHFSNLIDQTCAFCRGE